MTASSAGEPADHEGPDDNDVIDAAIAGSEEAWSTLVHRYSRLVYSVPRRYGFDTEASEDVFQEVFAVLFRRLADLRNRRGLPKWLLTTAHRVCGQMKRHQSVSLDVDHPALDSAIPPHEALLAWEEADAVRKAMRRLGGRCEDLLTALYLERSRVRYEELAKRLGMAEGSIGPTRARCLEKLLALLDDEDDSTE